MLKRGQVSGVSGLEERLVGRFTFELWYRIEGHGGSENAPRYTKVPGAEVWLHVEITTSSKVMGDISPRHYRDGRCSAALAQRGSSKADEIFPILLSALSQYPCVSTIGIWILQSYTRCTKILDQPFSSIFAQISEPMPRISYLITHSALN